MSDDISDKIGHGREVFSRRGRIRHGLMQQGIYTKEAMVEYRRGYMNWPLDPTWACETCGDCVLIWGLAHGVCRCHTCHTQYAMRADGERVKTPVCRLILAYKQPAAWGWAKWQQPISEWTDEMWDEAFAATQVEFVGAEVTT